MRKKSETMLSSTTITIILTLTMLTLAFRGHKEHIHDDICEGKNFLGIGCMMAQYDKILAKVISLPTHATKVS